MSSVEVVGLTKAFPDRGGQVTALAGIDLTVHSGEMLVLVGPSGCGKTTLLRCLAGLERADAGSISIGGSTVFDSARRLNVPPNKREISMVFQRYALWPHMTVERNVEYPLRARRRRAALDAGRATKALESVRCDSLAARLPSQLSGGQQQRVALARAVVSDPDVLLLDEPLSNLDALLRIELREELRMLHRAIGFTGVYVTHDQTEALSLGDRVAVMQAGAICQLATPDVVFDRPATPEVATFLGIRNRVRVTFDGGGWSTPLGAISNFRPPGGAGSYELFTRPEHVAVAAPSEPTDDPPGNWWLGDAQVEEVLFGGTVLEYVLRVADTRFFAAAPRGRYSWQVGDSVRVGVSATHTLCYADGVLALAHGEVTTVVPSAPGSAA